eukprot:279046-Amphidinium_carterae.1
MMVWKGNRQADLWAKIALHIECRDAENDAVMVHPLQHNAKWAEGAELMILKCPDTSELPSKWSSSWLVEGTAKAEVAYEVVFACRHAHAG